MQRRGDVGEVGNAAQLAGTDLAGDTVKLHRGSSSELLVECSMRSEHRLGFRLQFGDQHSTNCNMLLAQRNRGEKVGHKQHSTRLVVCYSCVSVNRPSGTCAARIVSLGNRDLLEPPQLINYK